MHEIVSGELCTRDCQQATRCEDLHLDWKIDTTKGRDVTVTPAPEAQGLGQSGRATPPPQARKAQKSAIKPSAQEPTTTTRTRSKKAEEKVKPSVEFQDPTPGQTGSRKTQKKAAKPSKGVEKPTQASTPARARSSTPAPTQAAKITPEALREAEKEFKKDWKKMGFATETLQQKMDMMDGWEIRKANLLDRNKDEEKGE